MEYSNAPHREGVDQRRVDRAALLREWLPAILLLLILGLATALRFTGLNWDEFTHIHPDERFLTMVESSIQLPESLSGYFDTAQSKLNPNNVGHGFFVYGTLPIFLVRYLAEWLGETGYDQVHLVGRMVSASFDVLSVLLVYLIGARLYRRRVALLASLFTALSVLLIQHAHFFVVDPIANTFILVGFYFAVRIMQEGRFSDYVFFGLALGMGVASKINAFPLGFLAALAAFAYLIQKDGEVGVGDLLRTAGYLLAAALISLITFRFLQPYAFAGPSFFSVKLNPQWLSNMTEIQALNRGDTDAPFALQWADRTPVLFALKNLVLWGMGLPLGLTAWAGWLLAAINLARGKNWSRHLLPVIWTGAYFIWQSIGFTPAMRYQLPVYPTLALLAAWGIWYAWDWSGSLGTSISRTMRGIVAALAVVVVAGTAIWAVAFNSIYTRPVTRVAATRWIYTHIPGAVNVVVDTPEGENLEPVPVTLDFNLNSGEPQIASFESHLDGSIQQVLLPYVRDLPVADQTKSVSVFLYGEMESEQPLAAGGFTGTFSSSVEMNLDLPIAPTFEVDAGERYSLHFEMLGDGAISMHDEILIVMDSMGNEVRQRLAIPGGVFSLTSSSPGQLSFTSDVDGTIKSIAVPFVKDVPVEAGGDRVVQAELLTDPADAEPLATGSYHGPLMTTKESRLEINLDNPVDVAVGQRLFVRLSLLEGSSVSMRGSVIVSETTWDDGLPLRVDGRDMGGVYTGTNQELYWQDDQDDDEDGVSDKLERIVNTLTEGDYLIITSNRQYGTITRVPVRYPLTIAYYRALLGCPADQEVLHCAAQAQPGKIEGVLGYELVAVFQSDPQLGFFKQSDQLAEEAFTVYDHPKVLIFKKGESYSPDRVTQILEDVDVSHVQHVIPKEVVTVRTPPNLMLPSDRWEAQQSAGTWSEIFRVDRLINRSNLAAVVVWWLMIGLFGVVAFPLTHLVFGNLQDGGYPLARIVGLLLLAWCTWTLGSAGVPVTAPTIALVLLGLALLAGALAWRDREGLIEFIRKHRREILLTEGIALAFFIFDLLVRLANPDLWHPAFGGEKPMDFSYLNAVLKSTTFPPYDPWFAGGYINYYYFGFVIVGMPIKLLGMVPSIAYNLVLPTLFALLALAAYSAGFNLVARWKDLALGAFKPNPRIAGAAAALAVVVLGNLGTARMYYDGLKEIGGGSKGESSNVIVGAAQVVRGLARYLTFEEPMPYPLHQWYWNPSRAITPAEGEAGPITEFPYFTFLYADLHAHMVNRPLTIMAIGWALAWLFRAAARGKRRWLEEGLALLLGGLIFGALHPTNTWDYPVYWTLGGLTMVYAAWLRHRELNVASVAEALLGAAGLILLSQFLYYPYHMWYGQGYMKARFWDGSLTPLLDYLTVHGLFLFVVVSWIIWETRKWMEITPLSALKRLRPLVPIIAVVGLILVGGTALLAGRGYAVTVIAVPLLVWCGILIFRPDLGVERRLVISMIAVSLALTLLVEFIVLMGDISRMNTVFKFYLEVWELFSLSAAAGLAWLLAEQVRWGRRWRLVWNLVLGFLILGAALYPLAATPAKMQDRMTDLAPHTLDGMAFMPYAERSELGERFSLESEYNAIRWMQENVQGTPVIVEANIPEYRWGSRFTIYTGLPGILGWNNHQRQQRVSAEPGVVENRAEEVLDFYLTRSVDEARDFLERYDVQYVVLGMVERIYFEEISPCLPAGGGESVTCDLRGWPWGMESPDVPASDCYPLEEGTDNPQLVCPTHGLEKFDTMAASGLLSEAYSDGGVVIYEVTP